MRVSTTRLAAAFAALVAAGCAHHVVNPPLARVDPDAGYRFADLEAKGSGDELFVVLTFSGGGTRAAALAYGVLGYLAEIEIPVAGGGTTTLLDEVDVISSVSGGSFTASYLALFGEERLFSEFEPAFLRRNVQGVLKRLLLYPSNWVRLASPHYDRIDMAARWYDRNVFDGARFADLVARGQRPFVVMNATDMGAGHRFEFTQDRMDYLCSDLSPYPVARGVAASSAFPGLLTPITLHDHAGGPPGDNACGFTPPERVTNALADRELNPRRYASAEERVGYLSADRPYVHLLDGGVADNIGLRGPYEALTSEVSDWSLLPQLNEGGIRHVVVIVVNAKPGSANRIDQRHSAPNLLRTLQTAASTPMAHYSFDTVQLLRDEFDARRRHNLERQVMLEQCPACAALREPAAEVHFRDFEVSFERVQDEAERAYLQELPTTFALPDEAIDRLVAVGRTVLAADPDFQDLLAELGATGRAP